MALRNLGRWDDAIASYQQALRIQPQSANTFYNLACTYALQGDTDTAIEYLQQAIHLDPNTYTHILHQYVDGFIMLRFFAIAEGAGYALSGLTVSCCT